MLLLAALLLIAGNALFVLIEFSLIRVRASRIEMLARKGSARAVQVQHILASLDEYLAAIQVGITVMSLALGWIGEPTLALALHERLERLGLSISGRSLHVVAYAVALLVLAFVQIVFGELLPRGIAIQRPESVALWSAIPLRLFKSVVRWPVVLTSTCSKTLLRLLGLKPAAQAETVLSEEEMRILLGETQERGALPLERLMLLENLFDFGAAKVSEAMTPRDKIVYLSLAKGWAENLTAIRASRHSRFILCETDLDTPIGLVHVKDLVLRPDVAGEAPDLKRLRRDLTEVLETDPLEKLLKSFPDKGVQMALVRNGLGRVVGLLTLEDIIEELVGEVHDEFDLPQAWSFMDIVVPSAVGVGLQADGRKEAIALLLDKLAAADPALKRDEVLNTVWERELKFSSAVGRGVAVPHGRLLNLVRPLVAVGRFARPVPFPSPDNLPVRLVFLILTPAATPVIQLKVLGRIASFVTNENLRRKIMRAKSAEALTDLLRTADTMLAS